MKGKYFTPHKRAWLLLLIFFALYHTLPDLLSAFRINFYLLTAISQIIVIVPMAILCTKTHSSSAKNFFRLRKISLSDGVLWFFFGICACCFFTIINIPIASFWQNFTSLETHVPPPANFGEYMLGVLCIAITPAICEELLCRGMVLREYESYSKKTAIIASSLAFSLLHNSIPMLVYTFLAGLLLSFVVESSKSIYPAIIIHFAINFFSLTTNYLSQSVVPMHMQPEFSLITSLTFIFLAFVFATMAYTLIKNRFIHALAEPNKKLPRPRYGISICMMLFVAAFIFLQIKTF